MVHFGIKSVAEVVAERRNVVQEKCTGRGASSRRFVQKIGEMTFFFVGGAAQVKQTREQGTMSEATRSTILLPITKQ